MMALPPCLRWLGALPAGVLLAAGTLLVDCGGATQGASTNSGASAKAAGPVETYLPLQHDTVLAYATLEENTGDRGLIMLEVTRPRPGSVELRDGGNTTRLALEPDGVRYQIGGYWLKGPLVMGACWQGKSGKTCVTRVDQAAQVPAGRFQGCVETTETTATGSRVVTLFCPGVGMTLLDVESDAGGQYQRVRAQLRSHGPKIDINHLPASLGDSAANAPAPGTPATGGPR